MEIKKIDINIQKLIDKKSRVKIIYFNEELECQILRQSDKYLVCCEVKDWHFNGFLIFPKKDISKIKRGKLQKFHETILSPLSQADVNLKWLDISSKKKLFASLFAHNKGFCIENKKRKSYVFELIKIVKLHKNNIKTKSVDLFGEYETPEHHKTLKFTSIYFDDEYSKKLFDYADVSSQS